MRAASDLQVYAPRRSLRDFGRQIDDPEAVCRDAFRHADMLGVKGVPAVEHDPQLKII